MAVELGMKFVEAVAFAADAHAGQVRKGTDIPYISHPIAVSAMVLEFGGNEDQAVAALLHDVVEDCDPVYADKLQEVFGDKVCSMVFTMTDGIADSNGNKPDWRTRKERYTARLQNAKPDVLLVVACDKLHNASSLLRDLQRDGLATMDRFNASVEETIWYYTTVAKAVSTTAAFGPLSATISAMIELIEDLKTTDL